MRAPLSWLREYAAIPSTETGRSVAARLIAAGLEVETVISLGAEISGSLLVGAVTAFTEEEHSNGKTIRWCEVDIGEPKRRGIVCGARNFEVGARVVVALPGTVLPGGFEITARKTYGHVSDGMICSERELGIGDDHSGILVLPAGSEVGANAVTALGLDDEILDIAVTPDRGYCLSMRGLAREAATAYGVAFTDPAGVVLQSLSGAQPAAIEDTIGCDRFVVLGVRGLEPARPTPGWMSQRIAAAGMRPISLVVDVTNYVMLELGQPLHAYDGATLGSGLGVRRAQAGESLETLDGSVRTLDPDDLVIVDDSGVIGLAGVMGGASTEISADTSHVVLEAAHFDPASIARAARRHKLPSEASRRFERGVDAKLAPHAAVRAAALLVEHGGGEIVGGSDVDHVADPVKVTIDAALPSRISGAELAPSAVAERLRAVGCDVTGTDSLSVTPPSWRPDITDPFDLVEEVVRLGGYDAVPSVLPKVRPGRGLTYRQRARRLIGGALASRGYVEVLTYPFLAPTVFDDLGLESDDPRRRALRLANPLSEAEPLLRTTLLPGLLATLRRNLSRGTASDVALFETGTVVRPGQEAPRPPRLGVERAPTADELAALRAALPDQPERVATVLAGRREPSGWWGSGRPSTWADAVEAARVVAWAAGVSIDVAADRHAPWHPGRCAVLEAAGRVVGHAGELHPRVVAAFELPPGTCAMELDLDLLLPSELPPLTAPAPSGYPVATQDVALVVDADTAAGTVEAALRSGAGPLLESVRLFDVYTGPQVGDGRKSLAFALRFRAPDRTLTVEEASAARDAAVAAASAATGAVLRS